MAESHKNPLYEWERKNPVRTYSRTQRVTTDNDISSWLKKVEDASNIATAQVFGVEYGSGVKLTGKAAARMTSDHVRHHDAAYSEAQDLLNEWMNEKVNLDSGLDIDDDYYDYKFERPTRAEVQREWDNLVDIDNLPLNLPKHVTHKPAVEYDLINQDESEIVDTILHNMLNKQVINDDVKRDLSLEKHKLNSIDPRTKMTLRHQQVKENREKREKELERKRREQQLQKEARSQAKRIVLKEEQAKEMKKKKEEEAVQKEMMKIRREMDEQRRQEEEERLRKRKQQEELENEARLKEEQLHWEEQQREILERRQAEERRRQVLKRLHEIETENAANNYKLMQKCFSVWYGVVLERRRQIGKARAMSDWKCLLRAWNAWKAFTRARHIDRETLQHEEYLREQHRKSQLAYQHYCWMLMRKCVTRWQVFVQSERQEKSVRLEQNSTCSKMSAFLDAAASGKLWEKKNTQTPDERNTIDSARLKVDELFENVDSRRKAAGSGTFRSDCTTDRSEKRLPWKTPPVTKPREAWQVTRKHVNLSPAEITSMTANGLPASQGSGDSAESSPSHKKKPWEKTPPALSTFENRHQAQQKILKEQQQQLKEQKRLIEELQYLQKQQFLQQQLHQQQLLSKQLTTETQPQSLQDIQVLIKNLQKNIQIQEQKLAADDKGQETVEDLEPGVASSGGETERTCTSVKSTTSSKTSKHDEFVKGMEQRAAERARIKAEREEKKRKAEEEKLARLQAEEEERQLKMEQEKKARIEARKEQKRLEKQREEEKQKQIDLSNQQMALADNHYASSLLVYKGWKPWRRFIEQCGQDTVNATRHHNLKLLQKLFLNWRWMTYEAVQRREDVADEFYKCLIIRRCFNSWKKYGQYVTIEEEKAQRFYDQHLMWRILRRWSDFAVGEKVRMWELERKAKEFNSTRVVRTVFRTWRRLPDINRREREKEAMRLEMRRKVASILPDFRASDKLDDIIN
ncbi:coiled-coil domain-containing protein 191-like [Tubulanus polymorphus]|uniref:coiled-coil domain-containing protein 191-like n=1 Tax=Tubulanus polymorphus TaxID=672921 RepID=UPI003DA4344E